MSNLLDRSSKTIAQGSLTNSKRPSTFVEGIYPTHVIKGRGCKLIDENGNSYVDYICGLGANLLGYDHHKIRNTIIESMYSGCALSLSTDLEIKYAEQLQIAFPCIERVKFLKTGSEACTASLRIARAYTKRPLVISEGYHGWHDEFVSLMEPAIGVNKKDYSNIVKLQTVLDSEDPKHFFENAAAIIIEPVIVDDSPARINFVKSLREVCDKFGIVLIFDEIVSGFRYDKLSFANCHDIKPDILLLGKAAANGLPISIVGGKELIMNCGEYFVSSTFAGERISLAAAIETLRILKNDWQNREIWMYGGEFKQKFNQIGSGLVWIDGYNTRGSLQAKTEIIKALFMQEMCRAGILFGPSWFFCLPHISVSDIVLNTMVEVIARIKSNQVKLEGRPPASPFAQRVRDNG